MTKKQAKPYNCRECREDAHTISCALQVLRVGKPSPDSQTYRDMLAIVLDYTAKRTTHSITHPA